MNDLYSCRGKGGIYLKLGVSKGAGPRNGERLVAYQSVATGEVFHREIRDFEERMQRLEMTVEQQEAWIRQACAAFYGDHEPASEELLEILKLDATMEGKLNA